MKKILFVLCFLPLPALATSKALTDEYLALTIKETSRLEQLQKDVQEKYAALCSGEARAASYMSCYSKKAFAEPYTAGALAQFAAGMRVLAKAENKQTKDLYRTGYDFLRIITEAFLYQDKSKRFPYQVDVTKYPAEELAAVRQMDGETLDESRAQLKKPFLKEVEDLKNKLSKETNPAKKTVKDNELESLARLVKSL